MRSGLARQFEAAPLVRLAHDTLVLGAGGSQEITASFPYEALIDGAPFVHLRLGYALTDANLGPCVCVGTAGVLAQATYQRVNVAAGWCVVRVRYLRPRLNAAATTLRDGQRVFLFNRDGGNQYAVEFVLEAPSLNWV